MVAKGAKRAASSGSVVFVMFPVRVSTPRGLNLESWACLAGIGPERG